MKDRETSVPCSLCGRPFDRRQLTRHHCLPREHGGTVTDIELLCPPCHGMVHPTYTNATLAHQYTTIADLRRPPELVPFLRRRVPGCSSRSPRAFRCVGAWRYLRSRRASPCLFPGTITAWRICSTGSRVASWPVPFR